MNDESVLIVAGLGNPGESYRRNRHNIGFRAVEKFARELGADFLPAGSCLAAETAGPDGRVVLLKPQTYMNRSGEALAAWSRATQTPLTGSRDEGLRPLIVCDDLSLPLGSLRLRAFGSSGGQNGLADVIEELGGEDIPRMRLGIAGGDEPVPPEVWPDYVLADFETAEEEVVAELVERACRALACVRRLGLEGAASRFNRRIRPAAGEPDGSATA